MADAVITLKLTPAEFDLLRRGMEFYRSNEDYFSKEPGTDIKIRHQSKREAALASEFLGKLQ